MKNTISLLIAMLSAPLAALHAEDTTKVTPPMTFTNPIIAGDYPDPTIVKVGDEFFMTHTSGRYSPGLLIWKSLDLIHWTPVTRALNVTYGDIWAPEIVHHHGKFYIYSHSTTLGNFVISASVIEGPWSKPVKLDVGEIDPGHVVGPDGKRYLHFSQGKAVGLSDDGLSVTGKLEKVYDGWPFPKEWHTEGYLCLESPKLFFKDGYYHMISAQGGTGGASTSHMVVEARSRSPLGPWENSPYNPVIRGNGVRVQILTKLASRSAFPGTLQRRSC